MGLATVKASWCALGEVRGNCRHSIGLVDAEAGDGKVRAVEADERDVGTVQGGDEGQAQAALAQHLPGQVGRHAVRDGVMHVQEVERVELGDFGHAGGEREVIGRVLEERIVEELHLMEVDVGLRGR